MSEIERDARDMIAGEYVLGLLSAAEAAGVERSLPSDSSLRDAVEAWERRLSDLNAIPRPVRRSPGLWRRIEATLDVGAAQAAGIVPTRREDRQRRAGLWSNLAFWRGATALATAAAASLAALFALTTATPVDRVPVFVAVLQQPDGAGAGYLVNVYADESLDLVPLRRPQLREDRALQFWTKAETAQAPTSLGLVPTGEVIHLPPGTIDVTPNQLFELTLEPASGSPTGRPTGPVQFIGRSVTTL